jgi:hypothetical protein
VAEREILQISVELMSSARGGAFAAKMKVVLKTIKIGVVKVIEIMIPLIEGRMASDLAGLIDQITVRETLALMKSIHAFQKVQAVDKVHIKDEKDYTQNYYSGM